MKKPPGPEPKLTARQTAQLRGVIIGKDLRQFELDFALWTRELVREVIKRKFGVEYTLLRGRQNPASSRAVPAAVLVALVTGRPRRPAR